MEADGRKEMLIAAQTSFVDHSNAPLPVSSKQSNRIRFGFSRSEDKGIHFRKPGSHNELKGYNDSLRKTKEAPQNLLVDDHPETERKAFYPFDDGFLSTYWMKSVQAMSK
jgi:hypothetical protein